MTTKQWLLELIDYEEANVRRRLDFATNTSAVAARIREQELMRAAAARRLVEQCPEEPTP